MLEQLSSNCCLPVKLHSDASAAIGCWLLLLPAETWQQFHAADIRPTTRQLLA